MPFHDLNVIHSTSNSDLTKTLGFLSELGYGVVAVSFNVTGKLPQAPPVVSLPINNLPRGLQLLSRLTLTISDPSQNHRLASLQPHYDILALRPTNEKAFVLSCTSLECDLISLDFSQRLPFILKFKTISAALQRGIRFEICYGSGITAGNDARRNLISGATALNRATRGRGMIISSEAKGILACRGPWDVINLAQLWGLARDRCKEALCEETGKVVRLASLKRTSYRGVVDVIDGGILRNNQRPNADLVPPKVQQQISNRNDFSKEPEKPMTREPQAPTLILNGAKRRASSASLSEHAPPTDVQRVDPKLLSKREMKRRAKRARLESKPNTSEAGEQRQAVTEFPVKPKA